MMLITRTPDVIIEDGPVGWHVWVEVDEDTVMHDRHFEDRGFARAYARGLSMAGDYPICDRSTELPGWETNPPTAKDDAAVVEDPYADDEVRIPVMSGLVVEVVRPHIRLVSTAEASR